MKEESSYEQKTTIRKNFRYVKDCMDHETIKEIIDATRYFRMHSP